MDVLRKMAGPPKDVKKVVRFFFLKHGAASSEKGGEQYEYCQKALAGKARGCLDNQT